MFGVPDDTLDSLVDSLVPTDSPADINRHNLQEEMARVATLEGEESSAVDPSKTVHINFDQSPPSAQPVPA